VSSRRLVERQVLIY